MALEDDKRDLATVGVPAAKKQKREFWTKEDKQDPLNTLLQAVQNLEKYEQKTANSVVKAKIERRPDTKEALEKEHEEQSQVLKEKFQLLSDLVMKLKSQYGTIEEVNKQLGLGNVSSSSSDTVAPVKPKTEELQAKFLQQLLQFNEHMEHMKKQKPLMIKDDPAIEGIDRKINEVDEKLNSIRREQFDISAMAVQTYIEKNEDEVERQAVQQMIDGDNADDPNSLEGKAIDKMIEDDTGVGELRAAAIDKIIEDDDDDALKEEAKEKKFEAEKDAGSESDSYYSYESGSSKE